MTANGQLQTYYMDHQLKNYSKSTIAWLGSVQTLIEFGFAVIMGRFFDLHGAKLLATSGTLLAFVAVVGMAFSKEYWQFLLSFIAFGFSGSFIYAPSTAVVAHWFLKKRATAVGIVVCGAGFGTIIYPIMFENLIKKLSYRDTMLIIAGFNFVLMAPSIFLMKPRLPPHDPPPWSDLKRPWKDTKYVILVASAAMYALNLMSPSYNALNLARANEVAKDVQVYGIAIVAAGSIAGRIFAGQLADRIGVWTVACAIPFLTSATMFAFWTPPMIGTAATTIGLIFFGMCSGAWFTLVGAATASISPLKEVGMRFGLLVTTMAVPSMLGPVISGALIQANGGKYTYAGIFNGLSFLLAGFLVLCVPLRIRYEARKKSLASGSSVGTEPADDELDDMRDHHGHDHVHEDQGPTFSANAADIGGGTRGELDNCHAEPRHEDLVLELARSNSRLSRTTSRLSRKEKI